jgi:hypothetical protein
MEYLFAMNVVNCSEDAGYKKLSLVLCECLYVCETAAQVSPGKEVHYEVEVIAVVERAGHVGDKGRTQVLQDLALV